MRSGTLPVLIERCLPIRYVWITAVRAAKPLHFSRNYLLAFIHSWRELENFNTDLTFYNFVTGTKLCKYNSEIPLKLIPYAQ